jgi:hypothetical protein
MAWFYFAGHGFELTSTEQAVLLMDFGKGVGPLLRGAVSVNNLFYGMAPSGMIPTIARTQAYFIDTGRRYNIPLPEFERRNTTAVFDADLATIDDRKAGVFYASIAGERTESFVDWQTLFSAALMDCLNGAAATVIGEREDGTQDWGITLYSLAENLPTVVASWSEHNRVQQRVDAGGSLGPGLLCRMDEPPEVQVSLHLEPEEALSHAQIAIDNADGIRVWNGPAQPKHVLTLPAGLYHVQVSFDAAAPWSNRMSFKNATPSAATWKVRVV